MVLMNKLRPWRHSSFKMYLTCQYAFYLQVVKKAEQQTSPAAEYGTMGHYFNECQLNKDMPAFTKRYPSAPVEELETYWQMVRPYVIDSVAEKRYFIDIDGNPLIKEGKNSFMWGTIDSLYLENLMVHDYKYGLSGWDFKSQADWYVILAYFNLDPDDRVNPMFGFTFRFLHPRVAMGDGFKITEYRYKLKSIPALFEDYKATILDIEKEIAGKKTEDDWLITTDTRQCGRCFVAHACKHTKKLVTKKADIALLTETAITKENLPQMCEDYLRLQGLVKKITGMIEAGIDEHGNVELPDGSQFGRYTKTSLTVKDTKMALVMLLGGSKKELHNEIKDRFLKDVSLGATKLRAIGKKHGVDVEDLISEKSSNKFGVLPEGE